MSESKLHCEECDPTTGGKLLKSLRMLAGDWKDDLPANGSFHADGISEGIRGCGRALQQLLGEYDAAAPAVPDGEYEVTWLTEPEARQRAKPWTAAALPAADPWGTAESDLDDDDEDDADEDDTVHTDEDEDEGEDDGKTTSEPRAAGQPRDLAPEAGAHPWFGPAGAAAAAPANPIEAAAKRAVGWPEEQPQQGAANGAGAQAAQRMML